MCGVAGLFLKDPALEPQLGRLVAGMLAILADRGPDSAGIAVYGAATPGRAKLTVRLPPDAGAGAGARLADRLGEALGRDVTQVQRSDHVVLSLPERDLAAARAFVAEQAPGVRVVGAGSRMELFKGTGRPQEVTARFRLSELGGTHAIGHTRMATESAVTIAGAHPFSTGLDQCLVHNGSLSNHNSVRRRLARAGIDMETANDSEVAAGYLSWRMAEGASLAEALDAALRDLDGFFTFVVGTDSGFAVLRDPVACKPAVMAETERYVAFGSEYRALVELPGIEEAHIFEPEPARVYAWSRGGA